MFTNRLYKKFMIGVILILLLTLTGTLFANSKLVERFYLYGQREYVREIGQQLKKELEGGKVPQQAVQTIEEQENVLIVYSEITGNPEKTANELRKKFREKGLGFQRYWLWEQDYETALQNGSQFRLYSQNKMNYSILVQYIFLESGLYAVAAIVPEAEEFISIVNYIGFFIYSVSILLAILLIYILTRHITRPLFQVCVFTHKVSSHDYQPLRIQTGDELEEVANRLNEMAEDIGQYQKKLEEKNEQMKQLLNNVAHDLKTPLALTGMYAAGMKDGLDDGTFLDTIIRQNNRMAQMIEKLLYLSRIEHKEEPVEILTLDELLVQCMEEQKELFEQHSLKLLTEIQHNIKMSGNREQLRQLLSNLLSNAAKYASSDWVAVKLWQQDRNCFFLIENMTDNMALDTEQIWQPFYVGESSRNKELSGTGLGLSIVKKISEQFGYSNQCIKNENRISFQIVFPVQKFEKV